MSARIKPVWLGDLVLGACAAVALIAPTAVAAGALARSSSATARCRAANTEVWLGDGTGGGVAGGVYYPLEFSNVGRRVCALTGYPGVSAFRGAGHVGPAAIRITGPHGTVTLAPGATAHAILKITDWGALCSNEIVADGLKVFAPGQTQAEPIDFSFGACAHQGVLSVGPVRAGVGIPGYTTR
jgi:hypothetical protein